GSHTDVFALGAILYRALTGLSAFPSRNLAQVVYEAMHHYPMPPSQLRPELPSLVDAVVMLALAKRPSERYASARELAVDLGRALDGTLPTELAVRAAALVPGSIGP